MVPTSSQLFFIGKKVYRCCLPDEQEAEHHNLPDEAKRFMFAPRDIAPWQIEGKDNLHGIGYSGMQEQSVLRSNKATKALYGLSGEVHCVDSALLFGHLSSLPPFLCVLYIQAFGLGALEEEEAEDDVYGVESLTSYNLTVAEEGDIRMEQKYGWTGSNERGVCTQKCV